MELINEATSRFAEEKDYRLMAGSSQHATHQLNLHRLSTALWLYSEQTSLGAASSAKGSKSYHR
jgi:hypothetical protein